MIANFKKRVAQLKEESSPSKKSRYSTENENNHNTSIEREQKTQQAANKNFKTKFDNNSKDAKLQNRDNKVSNKNKTHFKNKGVSDSAGQNEEGNKKGFNAGKKNFKNKNFTDTETGAVNWNKFKQEKKDLKIKRKGKELKGKNLYDVTVKVKKIGENLRRIMLKGDTKQRDKMVNEIHELVRGQEHYPKLVMAHDMARIVQYLLKFGSPQIREEISQELYPISVDMLRSKYAKHCVKRMLKYGTPETRSNIINACYASAVKLASHSVSADLFDYAYSTWATELQKRHLFQEFFGDMYKRSKDDNVKHLRDVYSEARDMKMAALSATKANIDRIVNKELLDSHLVQTVLMQYLQECSPESREELIEQLIPHVVVLSNSKEGSRAVMICIWHSTAKERKLCVRTLKEHVLELAKHEHGHCTIITMLDSADDTVLINKVLVNELIKKAYEIATDEWGRKTLLWLVAPGDSVHYHPLFIKELDAGREMSKSKKDVETRRKEILLFAQDPLLNQIVDEPAKWLANGTIALVTLAILKAASGFDLGKAFNAIAKLITDPNWCVKEKEEEISGMEHAGLHMVLKKLVQHDKTAKSNDRAEFGAAIVEQLTDDVISKWIGFNRGCFFLVNILESDSEEVQQELKNKLKDHVELVKKQKSAGARILLEKMTE